MLTSRRRVRVGRALGLLVGGSVTVAGCGMDARSTAAGDGLSASTGSAPSAATAPGVTGRRLLTCGGGLPFEPAALNGPLVQADDADPAVAALREGRLQHPGPIGELRLLARTDNQALLAETVAAAPPPLSPSPSEPGAQVPYFTVWNVTKEDGTWRVTGGGSCSLGAFIDGLRADPWELDPAAAPPGPESRAIAVLVHVRYCTSGQSSTDRIRPPQIVYGTTTVEIAITTDPPDGPQTCQGSPPTPYVVQLSEALGQRQLLDSGREPISVPSSPGP